MRRVELEKPRILGDDDPAVVAVDRDHVLAQQQPVLAVSGADGHGLRLALFAEPHLLDPADVARRRLDDEAVRVEKPLVFLGDRRHAQTFFRSLSVCPLRQALKPSGEETANSGGEPCGHGCEP